MSRKANLHKAKTAKNDEFYTQLEDIQKEMTYYREHFRDKVVYLNCDNPEMSQFWTYFSLQFEVLGLKKLIATHYSNKVPVNKWVLEEYGAEPVKTRMSTNGDFRSQECIDVLKEVDIVVTNPPFSLFREYLAQLMEYDKKFLIVGSMNAITYKEVFAHIKADELWLGTQRLKQYTLPINEETIARKNSFFGEDGLLYEKLGNTVWYTNLDHRVRNEELRLCMRYEDGDYPVYDNYDAINVNKTLDIPVDYNGVMGVPISFLNKYNAKQFEIVGLGNGRSSFTPSKDYSGVKMYSSSGKVSSGEAVNRVLTIRVDEKPSKGTYYIVNDEEILVAPYARILIRRR